MYDTAPRPVAVINRPRLRVTSGPLAGSVVERFIGALACDAQLSVARLDEAALVGRAIAEACAASGSRAEISVLVGEETLRLRVGPLAGGATAVLEADETGVVRTLSSSTEIRYGHGGEYLVVVISED